MQSGRDQLEEADPQAEARMSGIVVASSGTMSPTNEPYERIPGHVWYPTAEGKEGGGGCERGGRYNPSSAHLTAGRPALTTHHGPEAGDDARAETTDTGAEDEGRGPRATARPKAKLCQEGGRFPTLQVLVARN